MRRLAVGEVLAVAAGAGLAGADAFAFFGARQPGVPDRWGACTCRQLSVPQGRRQEQQGGGDEEVVYGRDDQRRFWDTVVEVLKHELGTGDEMSRVWEFVQHNREGKTPTDEYPSYRATGLYFPGLEAKPWWDRSEFPWLQELEAAAPDITLEMEALAKAGGGASYRGGSGEMSTVYDATQGWGTMRLRYMGRFGQPGINYSLLPRTLSVLRRLPLAPETAAFQRQLPGTGLPLHVDPSNFILGCHVGVVIPPPAGAGGANSPRGAGGAGDVRDRRQGRKKRVGAGAAGGSGGGGGVGFGGGGGSTAGGPKRAHGREPGVGESGGPAGKAGSPATTTAKGADSTKSGAPGPSSDVSSGRVGSGNVGERAWIEVSGEKRHWEAGRAFVFDPSFLHRTNNPTLGERVILNIDIWHPGLEEVERAAVRRVCELIESWNERSGLFED